MKPESAIAIGQFVKKVSPMIVRSSLQTPLGPMTLAASSDGLCGAWFERQKHHPDVSAWPLADPRHERLRQASHQLIEYFRGMRQHFDLELDLSAGTAFQREVWRSLLDIPFGGRRSYGQLAEHSGHPGAARAVGAAVGRNPISIVVPYHRVLGAGGSLTGYAGGVERKAALLELESQA